MPSPPPPNPSCPFCAIALANPPSPSLSLSPFPSSPFSPLSSPVPTQNPSTSPSPSANPATTASPPPPAHIILSTTNLLVFLDHAPISRGHVLVVVRPHREKLSDVRVEEGEAVGRWLGVVSRAVVGAVGEDEGGDGTGVVGGGRGGREDVDVGDWNVVQNNGARAAQVVPHVHFHIIPRVGDDVPEVKARSWTVFGKGQREELDEDDAVVLVGRMRERLKGEVEWVRRREGDGAVRRLFGDGGEIGGGDGNGEGNGLWKGTGRRSKL